MGACTVGAGLNAGIRKSIRHALLHWTLHFRELSRQESVSESQAQVQTLQERIVMQRAEQERERGTYNDAEYQWARALEVKDVQVKDLLSQVWATCPLPPRPPTVPGGPLQHLHWPHPNAPQPPKLVSSMAVP